MTEVKLVVLGGGEVGKSALTIKFVQGYFVESYEPTIEDAYRKQAEVDGVMHQLDILDTAGQEQYRSLMDVYYRRGDGFMIVYSVLNEESWQEAAQLYADLVERRPDFQSQHLAAQRRIPVVICGNKLDLVQEDASLRRVQVADALDRIRNWNCRLFETSAKTGENVEDAFHYLIRAVKAAQAAKAGGGPGAGASAAAPAAGGALGDAPSTAPPDRPGAAAAPPPDDEEHGKRKKKKKKKSCAVL
eukprot:TRINITY_DN22647_c0_g1_i1.p1 TRINITY_DN22647_c0_g1~~TRINITY_DN22647_c0_g1_i1.p1  ORF type:complete len:267 (+),score=81.44 TRINITY_DN22647_c0_g1_i1:68-802(+)